MAKMINDLNKSISIKERFLAPLLWSWLVFPLWSLIDIATVATGYYDPMLDPGISGFVIAIQDQAVMIWWCRLGYQIFLGIAVSVVAIRFAPRHSGENGKLVLEKIYLMGYLLQVVGLAVAFGKETGERKRGLGPVSLIWT